MADRRQVERAPRIPVDVEVNCDGNKFVYSKNISESGIALIADHDFTVGQFIQLTFRLPGIAEEISAHGKVVRTVQASENFFEIGVSFWDVEDEHKKLLEDFFRNQK